MSTAKYSMHKAIKIILFKFTVRRTFINKECVKEKEESLGFYRGSEETELSMRVRRDVRKARVRPYFQNMW